MNADVNVILVGTVILGVLGHALIWLDPRTALKMARRLRARSLALDASRRVYRETWDREFPNTEPVTEATDAVR